MESFMEEFEHLKIQLEDIKKATNNFSNKDIGSGGFGKVYQGELSHYKGESMVAIKRLDRTSGQGDPEFWKEIMMLTRYTHQNLIPLLGFCDEGGEKILVYEHAFNGSLDRHISSTSLTWTQRIKICLDVARGLSYLHDANGTPERVLHCDIKSSNILLDDSWNAKISDMGLSKRGPANQPHTFLITHVVGTPGYCDPQYINTCELTKESDIYSFGVVLLEVLCGRLCFNYSNNQLEILVPTWKQSYKDKKLNEIIFQGLTHPMDTDALETFSDIAFQCLDDSRKKRPMICLVVEKLESALEFQEPRNTKLPKEYEELVMAAVPPLKYRSVEGLKLRLSKGVHLNKGNTWLSLNMKGERCELISIAQCLIPIENETRYSSLHNSRFAVGCYVPSPSDHNFKIHVRSQFLSPLITYTVNLVFKFNKRDVERYIGLKYVLAEGKRHYYSFLSDAREDGWLIAELFQFTSDERCVDLEILFDKKLCPSLLVEGIEFQPLEKVEHDVLIDEKVDMQALDTYFKEKLETIYKDGKRYVMLPTRAALEEKRWKSLPKTRFEDVGQRSSRKFCIFYEIESKILPRQTTYATYLIYKQKGDYVYKVQPPPVQVKDKISNSETCHIYLTRPQTPVIIRGKDDENTYNQVSRPKIKGIPQQRSDGWMEVQVWEFHTGTTPEMIPVNLRLSSYMMALEGIEVCVKV